MHLLYNHPHAIASWRATRKESLSLPSVLLLSTSVYLFMTTQDLLAQTCKVQPGNSALETWSWRCFISNHTSKAVLVELGNILVEFREGSWDLWLCEIRFSLAHYDCTCFVLQHNASSWWYTSKWDPVMNGFTQYCVSSGIDLRQGGLMRGSGRTFTFTFSR